MSTYIFSINFIFCVENRKHTHTHIYTHQYSKVFFFHLKRYSVFSFEKPGQSELNTKQLKSSQPKLDPQRKNSCQPDPTGTACRVRFG